MLEAGRLEAALEAALKVRAALETALEVGAALEATLEVEAELEQVAEERHRESFVIRGRAAGYLPA